MEVTFWIETLNEAIEQYGRPEIFNTDQGSQFTSDAFIDVLKSNDIQISMDGKLAQYTAHGLIMWWLNGYGEVLNIRFGF